MLAPTLPPFELGDITRDYYGTLYSGTPLALTCSLNLSTIDTTFSVTNEWIHNEEVVSNTSRVKQCITEIATNVYNATLYFYPLNSTIDDGEYKCTFSIGSNLLLSNISSNVSTYLLYEELGLPSVALSIINESRVQSVLQCRVTGVSSRLLAIPELQWFKEGELISSSFNTIENLGVPFSGLYRCAATLTISDINSTVASFATYDVIIQGTLRVSVFERGNQLFDDNLELVCTVNGSSSSNVSWYDPSGAQVLDASLIYVVTNSEEDSVISVLKFSSLRFSDNGEYQCLAQLDLYIASESINVSVQLPESLDVEITQDYTGLLYTGTPLTLICSLNLTAIDTNITVYSQWIRTSQNANIQTDSRLTQSLSEISTNAYESVLTFNPLDSLVDGGEYICLFTVSTDDVVTEDRTGNTSIQLSVNDAPPLFVNLVLLNISSSEVLLECSVTSIDRLIATPPTLELIFSDAVLYTLTGSSSQIFRLDRVQTLSGVYKCNAEVTIVGLNDVTVNGTGDNHLIIPDILDIDLSVTDEPLLGNEYSLVCTANGSITPLIHWYDENDEPLNTTTVSVTTIAPALISVVSVLTFNPLRLSNGGHYRCSAILANGNSTLVENDTVMVLIQLQSLPVLLSLDYDGQLYTGTPLILSCFLNISFIETSVLTDTQWTINELDILSVNQSRVIQKDIEFADNVFKSSLEFNPLNSVTDNGEVVCSFTVSPSTGGEYFVNATTRAAFNISVNALAYLGVDISLSSNGTLATVQCITSTIDRLIANPVLEWSYPSDALIVSSTANSLTFNPLLTSSAGQYACTASIIIDSINFIIQNSSTLNFTLQIPSPTVSITASPSVEVFHDTVLNLTCTATLSDHIDSPVEIIFEWFDFDDRITIETIIRSNGSHFESSALIYPEQYSGFIIRNYTCNVTISSMSHYLIDAINSFTIPITVQELPSFAPLIESTGNPVFGEELFLNCYVTLVNELRMQPNIYWQKIDSDTNETLMLSGQEYSMGLLKGITLTLPNLSFDSRGLYICGVKYVSPSSNTSEVTHENYTVTLKIPPVTAFILSESTTERIAGTFFELKCLLNTTFLDSFNSSLFPVSSQWLHNNSMVNSDRVTGHIDNDSNGFYRTTLVFYPLDTSDSGIYQCSLTVGIEDQYVQTTQVNTSTTLYIRDVPPLNVTITSSSNERSLGRPYSLTCSVPLIDGFISLPTLQWYNDNDDLLESSVEDANGSLTLSFESLNSTHAGVYKCSLSLSVPQIDIYLNTSASENITIQVPQPHLAMELERAGNLVSGTHFSITCLITLSLSSLHTVPTVSVFWSKDYTNITNDSSRVFISQLIENVNQSEYQSILVFKSLSSDVDSGNYTCRAQASIGDDDFIEDSIVAADSVTINVTDPTIPELLVEPTQFTGLESTCADSYPHDNVTLICSATFPSLLVDSDTVTFSLTWYHNNSFYATNISVLNNGLTLTSSLYIEMAGLSDSGTYQCKASIAFLESSNVTRSEEAVIAIKGSSLPHPVVVEDYISTSTSVSITFRVPLVVYTQEHYKLLYEGFEFQTHTSLSNEVIGNTDITVLNESYTIEIDGLEENHSYNFSVISYSCVGNTSSSTVTFTTKESIPNGSPSNCTLMEVSSRSVTLIWNDVSDIDQNGELTGYNVTCQTGEGSVLSLNASTNSITIQGLSPYTMYQCNIAAVNRIGQGPFLENCLFRTSQEAPSDSPTNVTLSSSTSFSLEYKWSPPNTPNGNITHYTLLFLFNNGSQPLTVVLPDYVLSYNLTGLSPYQLVTLNISAATSIGNGPAGLLSNRTDQYRPGRVNDLQVVVLNVSAARVVWSAVELSERNGIITSYFVNVTTYDNLIIASQVTDSLAIVITDLEALKPFIVNVRAINGASENGLNSQLTFFTAEGTPPAPKNITANRLNGTHMLISWEQISITEARGFIKFYRIILQVLSTSRRRRQTLTYEVPANTSSAVLGDLNPSLSYTVLVDATTNAGPGSPASAPNLPAPTSSLFQVKAGDFHSCTDIITNSEATLKNFFKSSLIDVINNTCQCNFESDYITDDRIICDETALSKITYRGRITTFKNISSNQLISIMQEWIDTAPTVPYSLAVISFDSSCPVEIDSFDVPLCGTQLSITSITTSISPTSSSVPATSNTAQSSSIVAPVSAVVGVLLIAGLVLAIVIVLIVLVRKRKRSHNFKEGGKNFSMTLANAAYASRSQIFSNTLQRPLPPNPVMELQKIDQEDEIYEHLDNDPGVKESAFKDKDVKNCELFENTYAGNDSGKEGQEPPTYMEVIGGIAGGKETVKPDGTDAAGPIDISNALSKIDDDHDYA
ncbi:PREDICTED: hemicentin-1-like [Amphimedon queenslandica]|uniref:Uncharacterized protein n=1 Tax=Amphimedon queenslandica TaxID=400682 RepID=A0AAN0JAW3_AMPQE|nr:PREDICTED: hemicentin-1-like [Amphimedon queenslandica]|eukprot:XP_019853876.1 PREDICTED: hemicentin-1-like [Amphimedon queenslandica]